MIRLLFLTILSVNFIYSDEDQHMHQQSHNHDVYVQGEKLEIDQDNLNFLLDSFIIRLFDILGSNSENIGAIKAITIIIKPDSPVK